MRTLLLSLLWGCSGEEPAKTSGTDVTEPEPVDSMADLPVSECGLAPYSFVDLATMGQVVSVEEAADLTLPMTAIAGILSLAGLPNDAFDLRYDVRTFRVRYTTQDRGVATEATMLLSFPEGAGDVPMWGWFHGTTGFTDACAPSALGIEGGAFNLLFSSLGFVVASPDYLGMNGIGDASGQLHPYTIGEPTALPSLDAIRAAWAFQETQEGLTSRATQQTLLVGASEGGFAALWSDRYQPYYLPQADVIGVVASVPPADIEGLIAQGLSVPGDTTQGVAAALTTWHDWYRFQTPLSDLLQADLAAALPDAMESSCDPGDVVGDLSSIEATFNEDYVEAVLSDDLSGFSDVACAAEVNSLAKSVVPYRSEAPVLYVVAEFDELVAAEPTRAAYQPLCDAGYVMEYIECARAGHTDGALWSLPEQIDWIFARVAGEPLDAPCEQPAAQACSLEGQL